MVALRSLGYTWGWAVASGESMEHAGVNSTLMRAMWPNGGQPMPGIEEVWRRIEAHAGERFHQIRGGQFTCEVAGVYLRPDRLNQNIPRSHFGEALAYLPLGNTVPVQNLRGPSFIYMILMDRRIRQADW